MLVPVGSCTMMLWSKDFCGVKCYCDVWSQVVTGKLGAAEPVQRSVAAC